jgi:hypothetical protein
LTAVSHPVSPKSPAQQVEQSRCEASGPTFIAKASLRDAFAAQLAPTARNVDPAADAGRREARATSTLMPFHARRFAVVH